MQGLQCFFFFFFFFFFVFLESEFLFCNFPLQNTFWDPGNLKRVYSPFIQCHSSHIFLCAPHLYSYSLSDSLEPVLQKKVKKYMLKDLYNFLWCTSLTINHTTILWQVTKGNIQVSIKIFLTLLLYVFTPVSLHKMISLRDTKFGLNFFISCISLCIILKFFVIICMLSVAVFQNIEKFWCNHSAILIQYILDSIFGLATIPTQGWGFGVGWGGGSIGRGTGQV